jgi:hypothetical protein
MSCGASLGAYDFRRSLLPWGAGGLAEEGDPLELIVGAA